MAELFPILHSSWYGLTRLDTPAPVNLFAVLVCALLFVASVFRYVRSPLSSIPTVGGSSLPVLSYFSALNHILRAKDLLNEGYRKYPRRAFKVALLDRWVVIISGPGLVEDARKRPESELSLLDAAKEVSQFKYTISPASLNDPFHNVLIKGQLTRSLPMMLPEIMDELVSSTHLCIPIPEHEWGRVNVLSAMFEFTARLSNRAFLGEPLCRDKGYLALATKFSTNIAKAAFTMGVVPTVLKPILGPLITNVQPIVDKTLLLVKPLIDERRRRMASLGGTWKDKPDDLLQWLIEGCTARNLPDRNIVERLLLANVGALNTTSGSMTHMIYRIAESSELLASLREEVESIIADHGWSVPALGLMRKLDSLMRESQRLDGISISSLTRVARKDVHMVDGTIIPEGTLVLAATYPMHRDEQYYPNPNTFDPYRFSRMREHEGDELKYHYASTAFDYLPFGHGKHSCPGRHFAAIMMKAVLAHLILNYDIKLGGNGMRPDSIYLTHFVIPSTRTKVLFRKRSTT